MKLKFKGTKYKRWDGIEFTGPGEISVDKSLGEYLVTNFPELFEEVNVETKERTLKRKTKDASKHK